MRPFLSILTGLIINLLDLTDASVYDQSNYTVAVSNVYQEMTKGRYPLLEQYGGMNFRCFAELYSLYTKDNASENAYEALAVVDKITYEYTIIAVGNNSISKCDYQFDNCESYVGWANEMINATYDDNIDYCGIKGDIPAV